VSIYPVLWHLIVPVYPVLWHSLLRGRNEIDNKFGYLYYRPPHGRMHCSVGLTDHDGSGPLSQSSDAKLWNAHCQIAMVAVTLNYLVSDNYRRVDGKGLTPCSSQKCRMYAALLQNTSCLVLPPTRNMQTVDTVSKLLTLICMFPRNQELNRSCLHETKIPHVLYTFLEFCKLCILIVCSSVLCVLFSPCQLAFSDYPDWGFSVPLPQL